MSQELLAAARQALASNQKQVARTLLMQVVRADQGNGEAWHLLSQALDDPAQQADCRKRAQTLGYTPPAVPAGTSTPIQQAPDTSATIPLHSSAPALHQPSPVIQASINEAPQSVPAVVAGKKKMHPVTATLYLLATAFFIWYMWPFSSAPSVTPTVKPILNPVKINADRLVLYRITGTTGSASVTLSNGQGGTEQHKVRVPWEQRYTMKPGSFAYLSAQNEESAGTITCWIFVDNNDFKTSNSTGGYSIASCDGAVP